VTQNKKGINSIELETRKSDLDNVKVLVNEFGKLAYSVVDKYYCNIGYETGVDRLIKLLRKNEFSKQDFLADPVKNIRDFLHGYFKDRGGNLPKVWTENNTVFLMTEISVPCITIAAEKLVGICHKDICNVYCRALAKGIIKIFEDFFPGIKINFYNKSSRRNGGRSDCIEAFQVVIP